METFLASFSSEQYDEMASALIDMGATEKSVDVNAFAKDLEKIFSSIKVPPVNLTTCVCNGKAFVLLVRIE